MSFEPGFVQDDGLRARRKEAPSAGQMNEGVDWVARVDGGLLRPRSSRKRGRCQL